MKPSTAILPLALASLALAARTDAACWAPVPGQSALSFEVKQADAPLQGAFGDFDARLCLDPDDPGASHVNVHVDLSSVNTGISELDEALLGPDFFDVDSWPGATFDSDSVTADGAGHYRASGTLTIRDQSHELEVPFSLQISADGKTATAKGETTIKRLAYGVGQGEWSDTKWVGDEVTIRFEATLAPGDVE